MNKCPGLIPSFLQAPMPSGRPWDPVWGSFIREFTGGKCCKVRCKQLWMVREADASRMHLHLVEKHSTSLGAIFNSASDSSEAASLSSDPSVVVGAKRTAQPHITWYI